MLRTSALASGLFELKRGIVGAVIFVFVGRTLDLPAALMGCIFAIGGISALGGAVLADRFLSRNHFGRTLILAVAVSSLGTVLLPIAGGPLLFAALWLAVLQLHDGADIVHEIGRVSLAQSATPDRLLGRVNAAIRSLEWGAGMAGILLGGLIGEAFGIRPTLVVAGLIGLVLPLWLVRTPIRHLATLTDTLDTSSEVVGSNSSA